MNPILNILLFAFAVLWFNRHLQSETKKPLLVPVLVFILATALVFFLSLAVQNDYLDGLVYLLSGCLNLLAFWICTSVLIVYKHAKAKTMGSVFTDLAQNSIVLIPVVLTCFVIFGARLKIGG